ncbi:MAG: response regulator [Candidatus Zixiibacteriota bacterium]
MTQRRVLIIEDEPDIAELISYNLSRESFQSETALSGEVGLALARKIMPDLIVLDIMLPGVSGLDVCRALRTDPATKTIPIVMLTAKDEEIDVVTGLEVGADDYITKPFSPKVLLARIRALLRRRVASLDNNVEDVTTIGDLSIDSAKHRVTIGGQAVELTITEYELLGTLVARPGWVFSRSQLIDSLRDGQHVITDRAIDVQVANLRKKLGQCGHYVETVRGVGYRFREMT